MAGVDCNRTCVKSSPVVPLLLLCTLLFLAVGILLYAVGLCTPRALTVFLSLGVLLIAVLSNVASAALGVRVDPFAPAMGVNVVYLLYFCVRPIFLMSALDQPSVDFFLSRNPATPLDYAWAVGYECIGLVCFHIGYYSLQGRLHTQPVHRIVANGWNSRRAKRAVMVGGGLAVISTMISISIAGGIAGALASVGHLREVTTGYAYALLGAAYFPIGTILLLANYLLGYRSRLAIACFFVVSVGFAALFGSRTEIAALIFSGIVLVASVRGNRGIWRFALLSLLIVISVTPPLVFWAFARTYNMDLSDIPKVVEIMREEDSSVFFEQVVGEFSAIDSFGAVLHGGSSVFPFRNGETYLDIALFAIPRTLWPSKPKYFGNAVGDYVTEDGNDVPPGQVGELYVNFHTLGIVVGMFLIGRLFGVLYVRAMVGSIGQKVAYSMLFPYALAFLTHDAVAGIVILLTMVLPVWPALAYIQPGKSSVFSLRAEQA